MPVRWDASKLTSEVERKSQRGIEKAALFLVREIKQSLKVPGPRKGNRGARASKPGEIPHFRTGDLSRSIDYVTGRLSAKVGTGKDYGLYLELGTKNMSKRPYLRPAIDSKRNRKKITELVARG
tara:strand:+ start:5909 stop:6280 length:372 start_codon:yes stop_codon:yes gene_type:complete